MKVGEAFLNNFLPGLYFLRGKKLILVEGHMKHVSLRGSQKRIHFSWWGMWWGIINF